MKAFIKSQFSQVFIVKIVVQTNELTDFMNHALSVPLKVTFDTSIQEWTK